MSIIAVYECKNAVSVSTPTVSVVYLKAENKSDPPDVFCPGYDPDIRSDSSNAKGRWKRMDRILARPWVKAARNYAKSLEKPEPESTSEKAKE